MVLKKSSSCLNSGATQRTTNGRAFIAEKRFLMSNVLEINVTPYTHSLQGEEEKKLSSALETIWGYLSWQGPHLSKVIHKRQNNLWQQAGMFSLDKSNRHHLLDRFKLLMADVEFLQALLPVVEIEFRRRQKTLNTRYVYRQENLVSSKIVEKSVDQNVTIEKKNSRKRQKFKNRGIQRPLVRQMRENKETPEREFVKQTPVDNPMSRLTLELWEAVHVDARSVKGNNVTSRYVTRLDWHTKKSSHKTKGCVHGRYEWKKGYTLADMRDDIQLAGYNGEDDIDDMSYERHPSFNLYNNHPQQKLKTFRLSDFVIENQTASSRCRRKKSNKEECRDEGWKEKYPKGSFVVVSKDEIESSSVNKTSWELVDTHDVNPSLSKETHLGENQSLDQIDLDLSQNIQERIRFDDIFKSETLEFDNSFFPIELEMSNEEKAIFTTEKCSEKSTEIHGFQITVGNCFPQSFVLHLHKPNDPDNQMKSFIIGRKLDVQSTSWLISVQGENCRKLRERLVTETKRGLNGSLCLSDFIPIALGIVTEESNSGLNNFEDRSGISSTQYSQTEYLWEMLPNRPNTIICSAEKAYSYLKRNQHHEIQQEHHRYSNRQEHHHLVDPQEHHHHVNPQEHHHRVNPQEHHHHVNPKEHHHHVNPQEHHHRVNQQEHHHRSNQQEHHHRSNQQEHHHRSNPQERHHHSNQQEHHHHSNQQEHHHHNRLSQNNGHESTFECDVCCLQVDISINSLMLPSCGHVFCVTCWRYHFYHCIRLGTKHLTCMAPRCSTRVDVTTAMTMLPHNRIKQWLQHVRDRYLHTNRFCNWCPGDSCSNVAVSLTAPLKSQFGVPVTCDCRLTWCSNCQSKPHWPASCDQMAAYNKLLDKVCERERYRKGSAEFYINLKPCPQCDYPIEKNYGCPSMVCTMCYFNFCWNCLKGASTHVIYSCKPNGNNSVTYVLTNELAHDLPLKYFPECLEVSKARRCDKLRRWALTLSLSRPGQIWPRPPLVSDGSDGQVVHQMTSLAGECLSFSEQVYTLQETFYVLLSFIEMNKSSDSRRGLKVITSKLTSLRFIADRLQQRVVGKSLRAIFKSRQVIRSLLNVGYDVITQLMAAAPSLQKISKHRDIAWVGELDPNKFMRYR